MKKKLWVVMRVYRNGYMMNDAAFFSEEQARHAAGRLADHDLNASVTIQQVYLMDGPDGPSETE